MTASELPGLRAARESVGMTRGELAVASGVSSRMIKAVEIGEKRPSKRTMEAFERALLRAALAKIADVERAVAACARLDATRDDSGGVPV
jgi:transcriptional regulator with XRE-family HTH domain